MVSRFTVLLLLSAAISSSLAYTNVYGDTLQSCSEEGMALTGFTRNGYCTDRNDDSGSHHVCIDLSSTQGGNFCDVTGQSDWCSSSMSCHEDTSSYCQVQHWCVCQWAFASYLQNAGGCDQIQDIVCDAINFEAVKAYASKQSSSQKYKNALDCLIDRCGLDASTIAKLSTNNLTLSPSSWPGWICVSVVVIAILAVLYRAKILERKTAPVKEQFLASTNSPKKYDATGVTKAKSNRIV